jgi:DNA-binding IclR family transcriptional regulator
MNPILLLSTAGSALYIAMALLIIILGVCAMRYRQQMQKVQRDKQQLLVELEQIRSLGYAREDEEFEMGVCSIAAPGRDYQGQIIAACGVSGPKNRMTDSIIQNMLPSLLYITRQISMKFGWSPNENLEAETSEERQT